MPWETHGYLYGGTGRMPAVNRDRTPEPFKKGHCTQCNKDFWMYKGENRTICKYCEKDNLAKAKCKHQSLRNTCVQDTKDH